MPSQPSTGIGLGRAPLRIAGLYASFGLVWIWLSDWLLIWFGYTESYPMLASAIKGTVFVAITAMLLYWLGIGGLPAKAGMMKKRSPRPRRKKFFTASKKRPLTSPKIYNYNGSG